MSLVLGAGFSWPFLISKRNVLNARSYSYTLIHTQTLMKNGTTSRDIVRDETSFSIACLDSYHSGGSYVFRWILHKIVRFLCCVSSSPSHFFPFLLHLNANRSACNLYSVWKLPVSLHSMAFSSCFSLNLPGIHSAAYTAKSKHTQPNK